MNIQEFEREKDNPLYYSYTKLCTHFFCISDSN